MQDARSSSIKSYQQTPRSYVASATLTGTDANKALTNANAPGNITLTLPRASPNSTQFLNGSGLEFLFSCVNGNNIIVQPNPGDTIRGNAINAPVTVAGAGTTLHILCTVPGAWEVIGGLPSFATIPFSQITGVSVAFTQITGIATAAQLGSTGVYTATLTGCTTSPTTICRYNIYGNMVTTSNNGASLLGTASGGSTVLGFTGLPAAIQPAGSQSILIAVENAGAVVPGVMSILNGNVSFLISGGFGAGTKGLPNGFTVSYEIN